MSPQLVYSREDRNPDFVSRDFTKIIHVEVIDGLTVPVRYKQVKGVGTVCWLDKSTWKEAQIVSSGDEEGEAFANFILEWNDEFQELAALCSQRPDLMERFGIVLA